MKAFIVFAHPEPQSYGSSLLRTAGHTLRQRGHEVVVSDLYAMGFNPVASANDFLERRFPEQLHYDREQKHAVEHSAFAPDIQAEIDKLLWCDLLILQFPLWWFSVPAMMKGWIDRVFVNGVAYGKGRRFDAGGLKGRKGMLALTTACYSEMAEPDGLLAEFISIYGPCRPERWPIVAYRSCRPLSVGRFSTPTKCSGSRISVSTPEGSRRSKPPSRCRSIPCPTSDPTGGCARRWGPAQSRTVAGASGASVGPDGDPDDCSSSSASIRDRAVGDIYILFGLPESGPRGMRRVRRLRRA